LLEFRDSAGGSSSPGTGWFAAGSTIEIAASADHGSDFKSWIGTGEGSYSGPENPAHVTMLEPILEEPLFESWGTGYDFTISASETDPNINTSTPTGSVRFIYLWVTCAQRGLSAFEAGVTGSLVPFGFSPVSGVLNIGQAGDLLLAVGGCPIGDDPNLVLGYWTVWDSGGTLCLGPSAANDIFGAVDCDPAGPVLWESPKVVGYSSSGAAPCEVGTNGCSGANDPPVFLELSQLEATAGYKKVTVSWVTSADACHDGFHVYRSEIRAGAYGRLTSDLLRGGYEHAFEDVTVRGGRTYFYKVGAVELSGLEVLYGPVSVLTPPWPPTITRLGSNHPNPFTEETEIKFSLASPVYARLSIYDVAGRLVRRVVEEQLPSGDYIFRWDGFDATQRRANAGIYFYRLQAGAFNQTRKMVYLGAR
jgi:hypothetical protein